MARPTPRLVSLIPSATEMVGLLGLQDRLVGRSHECDYPPEIEDRPVCTRSRITRDASSAQIDRDVQERLRSALSLYEVDWETLREVRPDILLTQTQCEVCGVTAPELESALESWVGSRPRIVSFSPNRFQDLWTEIQELGELCGVAEHAREQIRNLKARVVSVIEKVASLDRTPTVVCLEWFSPLMGAGNWIPELIELAGGRDLLGKAGDSAPTLEWETLVEADPECLLLMPCGFSLNETRRHLPELTEHPSWRRLSAVRQNRVFLVDGHQYFNRPGPRLVDSLEIAAEILHPDTFSFGFAGQGWCRPPRDSKQ